MYIAADTYLTTIMENGLEFQLLINYTDEPGNSLYRGGEAASAGSWMNITDNTSCSNHMPNKKILLWGAAYSEFNLQWNYSEHEKALNESDLELEVTIIKDEECTAAALKTIDQYGVVFFDTHGSERGVMTGVRIDLKDNKIEDEGTFKTALTAALGNDAYNLLLTGDLYLTKHIDVPAAATAAWWADPNNRVASAIYTVWASVKFFQGMGSLSNTVVYNNSCFSGAKQFKSAKDANGNPVTPEGMTVAVAILSRSPIAYYGWRYADNTSGPVMGDACELAENNLIGRLAENDSTGLWNLTTGNNDVIIDNFHPGLTFTRDHQPDYCYEETSCGTFKDPRDGEVYRLACIGGQKWFAENLRFDALDNKIPDNDPSLLKDYGRLYTWEAVSDNATRHRDDNLLQGLCPAGWHIPTREDVFRLFPGMQYDDRQFERQFVGNVDGNRYKSPERWLGVDPNISNMNETGFSALPAGYAYKEEYFAFVHQRASFWISNSMMKNLDGGYARNVDAFHIYNVAAGDRVALDFWFSTTVGYHFSCRCVED